MSAQQTPTPALDPRREQAARLREMAKIERCGDGIFTAVGDEEAAAYSRSAMVAMLAGADAIAAYRWKPVAELTEEDRDNWRDIVWGRIVTSNGRRHTDTLLVPQDAATFRYTRFLRLPKLEAL